MPDPRAAMLAPSTPPPPAVKVVADSDLPQYMELVQRLSSKIEKTDSKRQQLEAEARRLVKLQKKLSRAAASVANDLQQTRQVAGDRKGKLDGLREILMAQEAGYLSLEELRAALD